MPLIYRKYYIISLMNEAECGEQSRWSVAPEKEGLLQTMEELAGSFEKEAGGTRTESSAINHDFMAAMFSLLAKHIKNSFGESEHIYPNDFAYAVESILIDCQKHGEGILSGLELPEGATNQSHGQYEEFRIRTAQTAYTLCGKEFGDQVAEETLAIHEKLEEYNTELQ